METLIITGLQYNSAQGLALIQIHNTKFQETNGYHQYIHAYIQIHIYFLLFDESPCNVVANVLDCDIVINKFELQSRYYVHFRINTLRKGTNPIISPANFTSIFLEGWIWQK